MRIAATADIHLTNFSQDPVDKKSSLPERLSSLDNSLRFMFDYCRKEEINTVVIAGDLFHNKGVIYVESLNVFLDILSDYADIKVILIPGNHDLTSKSVDGKSAIRALKYHPNLEYINKPWNELFNTPEENNILFIPYNNKMIEQIKKGKADILISHFGLNEGVLNSGISVVADIAMKDLIGKYKLVILGHYHAAQEIHKGTTSLYYCGSPIQLDWGEANEEKRFLVFDNKTLDVESIPFEGYRKFFKLEVTKDNCETISKQAETLIQEGHRVKHYKVEDFKYTPPDGVIVIDKTDKDITNRGVNSSMTREEQLVKYMEIKGIPKEDFEFVKSIGLEIIQGV